MYHWAPSSRRESILRTGLLPLSDPTTSSMEIGMRAPYVCVSPTASAAWSLSGDMEWVSDIEEWDLWQVRLADGDEVSVRGDFGPRISEVRVRNAIPPDRVWLVATRAPAVFEPTEDALVAAFKSGVAYGGSEVCALNDAAIRERLFGAG